MPITDAPPQGWHCVELPIREDEARARREGVTRHEMIERRGDWLQASVGESVMNADYNADIAYFYFQELLTAMEFKLRWV